MKPIFQKAALLCISLLVISCSAQEDSQTLSVDSTESVEEVSVEAKSKEGKLKMSCNEETFFEKVRITTQCAEDADKDGFTDSEEATISLENTGRRAVELVFNGVLEREELNKGVSKRPFSKPSIHDIKTVVTLEPREALVLDDRAVKLDRTFLLDLSVEPIEYTVSESQKVVLACADDSEKVNEKIFGVRVAMRCRDKKLVIRNEAASGGDDDASKGYRGVVVNPNYPNNNIQYVKESMSSSSGPASILLLDNGGQDYEVEVFIP